MYSTIQFKISVKNMALKILKRCGTSFCKQRKSYKKDHL